MIDLFFFCGWLVVVLWREWNFGLWILVVINVFWNGDGIWLFCVFLFCVLWWVVWRFCCRGYLVLIVKLVLCLWIFDCFDDDCYFYWFWWEDDFWFSYYFWDVDCFGICLVFIVKFFFNIVILSLLIVVEYVCWWFNFIVSGRFVNWVFEIWLFGFVWFVGESWVMLMILNRKCWGI